MAKYDTVEMVHQHLDCSYAEALRIDEIIRIYNQLPMELEHEVVRILRDKRIPDNLGYETLTPDERASYRTEILV